MITGLNRYDILSTLASFWSTHTATGEYDKVKTMVSIPLYSKLNNSLLSLMTSLCGAGSAYTGGSVYKFKFADIFVTNTSPGLEPIRILPLSELQTLTDPEFFYIVPYGELHIPTLIRAVDRKLLLGIDFYYASNYLWFVDNPQTLFSEGSIFIEEAKEYLISKYNYGYKTNVATSNVDLIAKYLRSDQTPKSLKLALAALTNTPIIRKGGYLYGIKEYPDHTTYVFADESVQVWYEHVRLRQGIVYEPNRLVDNSIVVIASTPEYENWHRRILWNKGLSLDSLCPFDGLKLQDTTVTATITAISVKWNKAHIQFPITDTKNNFTNYWNYIHTVEEETGIFLNDLLGIVGTVGATATLNPIDFYFQVILSRKGLVIIIDEAKVPLYQEALEFIRREFPFGYVPIVFISGNPCLITDQNKYIITNNNNPISN